MDIDKLRAQLTRYDQEHLLLHWDALSPEQQASLYGELASISYDEVTEFFDNAMRSCDNVKVDDLIEAVPPGVCAGPTQISANTLDSYRDTGYKAISSGEVAVILLAGGQGTRLGVPYPKGMYNVGLPSGKTLYQIQAERLQKVQTLAEEATGESGSIVWYIMTSEHTKEPTRKFFEEHDYFGLEARNVVLFEQSQLPAFTLDGKIILTRPDKVALSPDGNGGLHKAIEREGILRDMETRGIRHTYVYCVDNILVRVADPEFIGFCIQRNTDCAAVVVAKREPTESVGVVCKVAGKYQVVEYSEISLKTAQRTNPDGSLMFSHGNICNHFFSVAFLRLCSKTHERNLRHHIARKKVPYVANDGSIVTPNTPNAIKMEKFVFDVFQFASNFGVWQLQRESGFSPMKNADGAPKDTPTSARLALNRLHAKYIVDAGGKLVTKDGAPVTPDLCSDASHTPNGQSNGTEGGRGPQGVHYACEISPLVSYCGEGLEETCKGRTFVCPLVMEMDSRGTITVSQGST